MGKICGIGSVIGGEVDMQQSQCFGETLNGQFFQMMGSDTRAMGRSVDVVRGSFSVSQSFISRVKIKI